MNKLSQWVSSRSLKISEEFYLEFEPLCIVINTLFSSRVVKHTMSSQNLSWRLRCVEQSHSILANKHRAGVTMSLPKLPERRQWPGLGGGQSQQSEPVTPTIFLLFARPWHSSDSLQAHNTVTHTRLVSCRGGGCGTITAARLPGDVAEECSIKLFRQGPVCALGPVVFTPFSLKSFFRAENMQRQSDLLVLIFFVIIVLKNPYRLSSRLCRGPREGLVTVWFH